MSEQPSVLSKDPARASVVWVFNPYDEIPGEGGRQRFWSLSEALAAEGCSVVWWSSGFSHRRKATRKLELGTTESSLAELPFELRLVETPAYTKNVSWARLRNHRHYGEQLYRDACQAVESGRLHTPDVIVASLPPMEGPMAALRLKQRFGCRVVTDVMDTWPDTFLQVLPRGLHFLGRVALCPYYRMLRKACAESDAISAQSHAFAGYARSAGASREVHVCYLGGNSQAASSIPSQSSATNDTPSIRLVYLGAMGRSYDLDTVLDAIEILLQRGVEVDCVFVGEGEKRAALEARSVSGVRFTGFLQGAELDGELQQADVGLVPFFRASGVAVPYKAGEYFAHGLPILSSIDGELGDLVREYRCGAVYSEQDATALADRIQEYAQNRDLLDQAKRQARACFDTQFDRAKTYPAFAKWILRDRM